MAKQGTDFELLVKAIYEEILSSENYENIIVEHDVKIKGKSGQFHQIDVYWEFIVAGIKHKVAVECKEYNKSVSIGKIRDFYGAIDDIGDIHGIFVTTIGYQSGAITYAEHKNISLKTISEPTQEEIEAVEVIREIDLNIYALCIGNLEILPEFDNQWIIKNTSIKDGDKIEFGGLSNEIKVIDSYYNNLGSIHDLQNKLPRSPDNTVGLTYKMQFDDGFLISPNSQFPPLKINSIEFKYDTYTISTHSKMKFKLIAEAILKDIITGDTHLYKQQALRENA